MNDSKIFLSEFDLEIIKQIEMLNLNATWKMILHSMAVNFLYSIRKAAEDGLKDKQQSNALHTNQQEKVL